MKVEELPPGPFRDCPRDLTLERFAELTGLQEQLPMLALWVERGILPTRRFGRHRLIDIRVLLQHLNHAQGPQG